MKRMRGAAIGVSLALALAATSASAEPAASAAPAAVVARAAAVRHTPIAGTRCTALPADNWWHADVSHLPVSRHSATWLRHMSPKAKLHPDFGGPYGIPITVVKAGHAKVAVRFAYADESDRVRYPLGADTRIEGGRSSTGDRHAIVVDASTCRLYETWDTHVSGTRWSAGSGATWLLTSNRLRPNGHTSADAAGLPILPGLLRVNEVRSGTVDHAIRFTVPTTSSHHLWPARHDAGSTASLAYPPMGARFRPKASFSTQGMSTQTKTVVAAMKKYGLVLADNGSPWFFQGEKSSAWSSRLIAELKRIPASAFVAVDTSSLRVSSGSGATRG
jgi:hypothetical protein